MKYILISVNDDREISAKEFSDIIEARHNMSEEWNEILSQNGYEEDDDVEDGELSLMSAYLDNECGQYNWQIIEIK